MNYAEARKISDSDGWHFTVRNDDRIWTAECCRDPGPPATEDDVERYGYRLGEPTLGKAHEPHATREEAEGCFNAWRRQPERFEIDEPGRFGDWKGCVVCDAPTKTAAIHRDFGGPEYIALCAEHLTLEHAVAQVEDSTRIIYS